MLFFKVCFYIQLVGIVTLKKKERFYQYSLWEKNVKEGELCNNPAGYYLGWSGLTNPLYKEQCRKIVYTVLYIRPGV